MTWIDVSHWNGEIDWPQARAGGVTHAYIKASEATVFTDSRFAANWNGARAAGVRRGAYHFFRGHADGAAQAQHFAAVVGADQGGLPPAIDVESAAGGVTRAQYTTRLKACLDETAQRFGRAPVIYTNAHMWELLTTLPGWIADYALWLAAPGQIDPPLPAGAADWWLHQYSWTGAVPGIVGHVDLDRERVPAPPPPPNTALEAAIAVHANAIVDLT